ncbi:MAG: hypothetical protein Q7S01_01755 [bacterium]|nr:hypothetical protein [bacterium]
MSDSEQDSSVSPSDVPTPESVSPEVVAATVDAAPQENSEVNSTSTADAEASADVPVAPPTTPATSPDSTAPVEKSETGHSNILENVGMSVEADLPASPSPAPTIAENPSASSTPQVESPAPVIAPVSSALLSLRDKALEAIQFKRRARLEKIIVLAEKKRSIGNDDVEKLLHVSDSTATRYLAALVREGKLQQTGVPQAQRYSMPSGSNGAD